jgi:hypothetical protein
MQPTADRTPSTIDSVVVVIFFMRSSLATPMSIGGICQPGRAPSAQVDSRYPTPSDPNTLNDRHLRSAEPPASSKALEFRE